MQKDYIWPEHWTYKMLFMMARLLKEANTLQRRKINPIKLKMIKGQFDLQCKYLYRIGD